MHPSSLANMQKAIDFIGLPMERSFSVLDIGGRGLKYDRSYKSLFEPYCCKYEIADIQSGNGVTIVMPSEYDIPIKNNEYDIVVSGQTFEHVRNPFRLMNEIKRVTKPSGYIIIIAPSAGPNHDKVDCWRFMRDSFAAIANETKLEIIKDWIDNNKDEKWKDHVFIGRKQLDRQL